MTDTTIPVVRPPVWLGPLMVFAGGVCIGFAPIGLRWGLGELGPQAIAFWRYVFALPMLFLLTWGVSRRLPRRPNKYVFLAGIFFTLDIALWHWALTLTTVSNATFIVNLGNVSVGFLAWLVLKEKPSSTWFIAILLAIAGAAALSLGGGASGKGDLRGDVLALGAAILVSGYIVFSKLARRDLGGLETIFWLTVTEILVAALVVIVSGETFIPVTLAGFAAPLFLAVVAHVGGQGLIVMGLGHTPTAIAGVLVLVQPVVAAAVSWVLFDEPLVAVQACGAGLILVAVWLAQQGKRPQPVD